MKGLLYKEWCMSKRNILVFMALTFVLAVLGILVALSMICGNLQNMLKNDPESAQVLLMVFYYMPFCISLVTCESCLMSVYGDYTSKWMTYSYTLPIKAQKAVGVRYIMMGSILMAALIFGFGNAGLLSLVSKNKLTLEIIKNLIFIWIIFATAFLIAMPLALKIKKSATMTAITVVLIMGIYFLAMAIVFNMSNTYGDEAMNVLMEKCSYIRDKVMLISPVYILLVALISFMASVEIYQRREKHC